MNDTNRINIKLIKEEFRPRIITIFGLFSIPLFPSEVIKALQKVYI